MDPQGKKMTTFTHTCFSFQVIGLLAGLTSLCIMGSMEEDYLNRIEMFFVKMLDLTWTWLIGKRLPAPTLPIAKGHGYMVEMHGLGHCPQRDLQFTRHTFDSDLTLTLGGLAPRKTFGNTGSRPREWH